MLYFPVMPIRTYFLPTQLRITVLHYLVKFIYITRRRRLGSWTSSCHLSILLVRSPSAMQAPPSHVAAIQKSAH